MRICLLACLMSICLFVGPGPARAGDPLGEARAWLIADLKHALAADPVDFNHVASVVFPLAEDFRRHRDPGVRASLSAVGTWLADPFAEPGSIESRVDHALIAAFLREAGFPLPGTKLDHAPVDAETAHLFALANALILACRYRLAPRPEGGLERLLGAQAKDGGFSDSPDARYNLYLTTHAVLALHACEAPGPGVERGKRYLVRALPALARAGFLDGLAETLVFLQWMEIPVPNERALRDYVLSRVQPDGGLCLLDRPRCRSHWHATAVLLELLNLGGTK